MSGWSDLTPDPDSPWTLTVEMNNDIQMDYVKILTQVRPSLRFTRLKSGKLELNPMSGN